jgi:hypothetical protein
MTTPGPEPIPPEVMAAMEEAARYALTGQGDPEVRRWVSREAARIQEEVFRKHGLLDIGVPAIRALRDGEEE